MSLLKKVKRCSHCGAILQDNDKNVAGYIDTAILKKYPDGVLLCNNCFEQEKSNISNQVDVDSQYEIMLNNLRKQGGLAVYLVDLFSFEGGFPSRITELLEGLDVLVIGNKIDLLPKNTNEEALVEYIKHRLRLAKLNVLDVMITSSSFEYNTKQTFERIIEAAKGRNVYFMGSSTCGKSTLINSYLKSMTNKTNKMIVLHTFKGTDLRGYKIPIDNNSSIYEIPSFPINNSMLGLIEMPVAGLIVPQRTVKVVKKTLTADSALIILGLAMIKLTSKEKTEISCYFSENVDLKVKKGNCDKYFEQFIEKGNQKNTSFKYKNLSNFDVFDIDITEKDGRDIGILGLGWISFNGNKQKFRVYVPKGVYVYSTRSKIKNVK